MEAAPVASPSGSSNRRPGACEAPIIALAGNPNCGKTTLFNALTGLRHKVANYPGVTVEKKQGSAVLAGDRRMTVVDLPGVYNLAGSSIDEVIACRALLGEITNEPPPDLIVSVVDASNLERNLFLTSQLIDTGIPVLVVLNMCDIATAQGITIREELLSRRLDVPVLLMVAREQRGIEELRAAIAAMVEKPRRSTHIRAWLGNALPFSDRAIALGKQELGFETSDDRAFIVGASLLSEARAPQHAGDTAAIRKAQDELSDQKLDAASFEATERYRWINEIVQQAQMKSDSAPHVWRERIDSLLIHRVWGVAIFLLIMAGLFQSIFLWASMPMDFIDQSFASLSALIISKMQDGVLRSLLVNGIVPGVGSVLVFVPQIAILFFFLGILEESGYLARAAFLMDRVMRPFGLQGRSFIPLLSSFACAIPGIMSTRTIPSYADRMATILVAPLMSCSARLPVYTLLIAACIPAIPVFGFVSLQGLVLLLMYLLGIFGAAIVAWITRKHVFRGEPALFVMEMPPFRRPGLRSVLIEVWDRVRLFIKSAGTIILACSVLLWFLASYPQGAPRESFAGRIGTTIEPVIAPLGFNWEIGVGILASFAAREVFVSSLATVYSLEQDDRTGQSLIEMLKEKNRTGHFSTAAALSLMVFYVFACQCISTLAICRRETGSWRWPLAMFVYMSALAYLMSLVTYQIAQRVL